MKHPILISILLIAAPLRTLATDNSETTLPGWHLVWHDEFDGDVVDEGSWYIEDAALVKNHELQYYSPDEVYIEDGKLVLRSQKRTMGGRDFSSGLVSTKGRFAQAFGRIEIRAKLPRTQGLWPAHWMLPADGSWPPEIDIMEAVGSQPNVITMSLHMGGWPNLDSQSDDHMGPDYSQDFHTYALEWKPDELRWYIDGIRRFGTQDQIPQKPCYLILNTAVGGQMPGDPDETTVFPQYHYIDYVRIYAKDEPGTYFLTTSANGGRVAVQPEDPENRYKESTVVTLKAYPSIGYRFSHWTNDSEGTENPTTVSMNGHKHVQAVFEQDPDAPALLSKGAAVTASSVEKDDCRPQYVTDGDLRSRWASEFSDPQWLMIDLGRIVDINAIRLVWENAHAKNYRIDASKDGRDWVGLHSKRGSQGGTEEIVGMNTPGRYIRLMGEQRATEWGYSLWEIEVFGQEIASAPEPTMPVDADN